MTFVFATLAAIVLVIVVVRASLWLSARKVGRRAKTASASGAGGIHDGAGPSGGSCDLSDFGGGGDCGGGGD